MFGLCFGLEYLEGGCLTGQSRFTFYVFFEYIADVVLVRIIFCQFHTLSLFYIYILFSLLFVAFLL